jgi:hypothetical protein
MQSAELTTQELDLLLDAVDAWLQRPLMENSCISMLEIMMQPTKEKANGSLEKMQDRISQLNKAQVLRSDRAILIKAKLIQIKQSVAADEAFAPAAQEKSAG